MNLQNIFSDLPSTVNEELVSEILVSSHIRIEKIVSKGHTSPPAGWYDQKENEWVMVLQGSGTLIFENGTEVCLGKGDYLNIPAHEKHKVSWTDPNQLTVWLALFYS